MWRKPNKAIAALSMAVVLFASAALVTSPISAYADSEGPQELLEQTEPLEGGEEPSPVDAGDGEFLEQPEDVYVEDGFFEVAPDSDEQFEYFEEQPLPGDGGDQDKTPAANPDDTAPSQTGEPEELVDEGFVEETPTEPTEPTDPTDTTEPTQATEPAESTEPTEPVSGTEAVSLGFSISTMMLRSGLDDYQPIYNYKELYDYVTAANSNSSISEIKVQLMEDIYMIYPTATSSSTGKVTTWDKTKGFLVKKPLVIEGNGHKMVQFGTGIAPSIRFASSPVSNTTITIRNVNFDGSTYYGVVSAESTIDAIEKAVYIHNMTYTGPQAFWLPRSNLLTLSGVCDFEIRNDAATSITFDYLGNTYTQTRTFDINHEFAEITQMVVDGDVTIKHFGSSEVPIKLGYYAGTASIPSYLRITEGSTLNVNASGGMAIFSLNAASTGSQKLYVEDNATLIATGTRGVFANAYVFRDGVSIGKNATVVMDGAVDGYDFNLRQPMTVGEGSTVFLRRNRTRSATVNSTAFLTLSGSGRVDVADPELFFLNDYVSGGTSSNMYIRAQTINNWVNVTTAGKPSNILSSWDSLVTAYDSRNEIPKTASHRRFIAARHGVTVSELTPYVDVITGTTSPGATVTAKFIPESASTQMTVNATVESDGSYLIAPDLSGLTLPPGYGPFVKDSTVNLTSTIPGSYGGVTVYADVNVPVDDPGHLFLRVPSLLDYGTRQYTGYRKRYGLNHNGQIVIDDTRPIEQVDRADEFQWQLSASASSLKAGGSELSVSTIGYMKETSPGQVQFMNMVGNEVRIANHSDFQQRPGDGQYYLPLQQDSTGAGQFVVEIDPYEIRYNLDKVYTTEIVWTLSPQITP